MVLLLFSCYLIVAVNINKIDQINNQSLTYNLPILFTNVGGWINGL